MQNQDAYTLTKGARRKFQRSRVVVEGIDSMWDVDLLDMTSLSKENNGIKYLLVAIDIFSRFAWCVELKGKKSTDIVQAFQKLFQQRTNSRRPSIIRTDKGGEFRNKSVKTYLASLNIHHFEAHNTETKATYVERFNKTIKHKIVRYLLHNRTNIYYNVLDQLLSSYNNSVHQSLGRSPSSITKNTEAESRLEQYLIRRKRYKKPLSSRAKKYAFRVGDRVRISHVRQVFDREYSQRWTGEIFTVQSRFKRDNIPVYTLQDWSKDKVTGTFYQSELQKVNVDENTRFNVDKILRRRTRNKRKEVLIRWLHWPKKFDSWLPLSDVHYYT